MLLLTIHLNPKPHLGLYVNKMSDLMGSLFSYSFHLVQQLLEATQRSFGRSSFQTLSSGGTIGQGR